MTSALYHGLFQWHADANGGARVSRADSTPAMIPCPTTGRPLRVATIDAHTSAICPACASLGQGGFVSFDGDLRMAYACPQCRKLIWLAGS
jgi:uncharacterized paraquat-inducible protein A